MSREIKFRAWDQETKEMSHDFLSKNWLRVCVESPYVALMQFTGLTDRNGIEIYEGDVLDVEDEGRPFVKNWNGIVKFIEGSYLIENMEGTDGEYLYDEMREVEVIGNIYTHPHLLKE